MDRKYMEQFRLWLERASKGYEALAIHHVDSLFFFWQDGWTSGQVEHYLKKLSMEKRNEINSNENHPELQKGEMWLTNASKTSFNEKIKYKSKRLGNEAYFSHTGERIPENLEIYPVFVNKDEYTKGGN